MRNFIRDMWPYVILIGAAYLVFYAVRSNDNESLLLLALSLGAFAVYLLYNISRIAGQILNEQRKVRRILERINARLHEPR